jgi:hypothetical protein
MELSTSCEATRHTTTQDFPRILWWPKAYYHIHKSPPSVSTLSQITPVHNSPLYLSKIPLNIIPHLHLLLPSGLFYSGLSCKNIYAFPFSPFMLHALSSHSPWLDHSNYIWLRVQVMKLLIMQFFPTSHHFIPRLFNYFPQHRIHEHPQSACVP